MNNLLLLIFIIITFTIILIVLNKLNLESNKIIIDVVYTWVDNDDKFNLEKNFWIEKFGYKKKFTKNRYENHNELKYSLRSICKHFPYFRNIYIIVKDGQKPNFIDFNNKNIKLINHSEIIPSKYLPTFNSIVIENYIHYIPELSEYYLYMNDDFLFLKNQTPNYFIDNNKNPYIYFSKPFCNKLNLTNIEILKEYDFYTGFAFNNYILDLITSYQKCRSDVVHLPKMYRKSFDFDIEKKLKNFKFNIKELDYTNIYDLSSECKFRTNYNLHLNSIIKPYLYLNWYNSKLKPESEIYITLKKNYKIDYLLNFENNINFAVINDGFAEITQNEINNYYLVMEKLFEKCYLEI